MCVRRKGGIRIVPDLLYYYSAAAAAAVAAVALVEDGKVDMNMDAEDLPRSSVTWGVLYP